jgi:hypothetical protein
MCVSVQQSSFRDMEYLIAECAVSLQGYVCNVLWYQGVNHAEPRLFLRGDSDGMRTL